VPHNTTIALVTGANKGIGRAIAQLHAETGMTVLIAAQAARRGGAAAAVLRAVAVPPSQSVPVLLGLGAGIGYALFVCTRFREELAVGASPLGNRRLAPRNC
jgi:NAD(P)-dependent dehydrogenase (short-subunit alcohol dehydrogenase family)